VPIPIGLTSPSTLLLEALHAGAWSGHASQLSEDHVEWSFLEEAARATRDPGHSPSARRDDVAGSESPPDTSRVTGASETRPARDIMLQRRSALAFDGRTRVSRQTFLDMLSRACPGPGSPWDALWWPPAVHLVLFVHRVDGLAPGLYLLVRATSEPDGAAADRATAELRAAMRQEFVWEPVDPALRLLCLSQGDCRGLARRLSCDQDIASDGFFSLAMLASFDASLAAYGPSFYRHLFWETGVIGQVLYLEAEAAGARATGIGCFYDDPVHDVLGLKGHAFQSLYHFTIGMPVEDLRLTSEPGYPWER
jgi:hypothetical protein